MHRSEDPEVILTPGTVGGQEPAALPAWTGNQGARMQFCIQDAKHPENTFCLRSLGKARKTQRTKTQMLPASARNTVTPKQQGLVCCGLCPTAASEAHGEA